MLEFVLGGIRSGKSRMAQSLATATGQPVTYIATALAGDTEMAARIRLHQQQRPADWHVVEEPWYLADALRRHADPGRCVVVDCLTLWLTQVLTLRSEAEWIAEREAFLACLPMLRSRIIFVSNESNAGLIPIDPVSRRYCDEAGALHQAVAAHSARVVMMVAGLPILLKGRLP